MHFSPDQHSTPVKQTSSEESLPKTDQFDYLRERIVFNNQTLPSKELSIFIDSSDTE